MLTSTILCPRGQKRVKVFQVCLETEDPDYVNEQWMAATLNDAFNGPEFHEPEGDHPPRLMSVSTVREVVKPKLKLGVA